MADHSPAATARDLGVADETLRKWAREFAPYLSQSAQSGKGGKGRRYQDADLLILGRIKGYLADNLTFAEIRARLDQAQIDQADQPSPRSTGPANGPQPGGTPIIELITPEQEGSERLAQLERFLAAQSELIQSQRENIASQRETIAQQQEQARIAQTQIAQLDKAQTDQAAQLDTLAAQLDNERAEKAAALGELGKIPRWLRALLGISSVM